MQKVAGEQGLALQQRFPYKSSYSNCHKLLIFIARGFNRGHFDVFNMLFPFLAFLKLQPIILWKKRHVMA